MSDLPYSPKYVRLFVCTNTLRVTHNEKPRQYFEAKTMDENER